MRRPRMLPVLSALAFATLAIPGAALASTPAPAAPRCTVVTRPGDGAVVPANAPALAVWNQTGTTSDGAATLLGSSLEGAGGPRLTLTDDPAFASLGRRLLVPSEALREGTTYTLIHQLTCLPTPSTTDAPPVVEGARTTFRAGPAVPLPTTIGTVADTGRSETVYPFVYTFVGLTPSPELRAYAHLTSLTLVPLLGGDEASARANGDIPGQTLGYGEWAPDGLVEGRAAVASLRLYKNIATTGPRYESAICGKSTSLRRVTFELRAHIAGTTSDPAPVTFEAPIDCSNVDPFQKGRDESGSESGGESGGESSSESGSGCAVAKAGAHDDARATIAFVVGLGLAARLVARRRHARA